MNASASGDSVLSTALSSAPRVTTRRASIHCASWPCSSGRVDERAILRARGQSANVPACSRRRSQRNCESEGVVSASAHPARRRCRRSALAETEYANFLAERRKTHREGAARLARQASSDEVFRGIAGSATAVVALGLFSYRRARISRWRRYDASEARSATIRPRSSQAAYTQSTTLTQQLVDTWTHRSGHLKPAARRKRIGLVRQFCLYLARQDSTAYVPEPTRGTGRTTQFAPHIYTVAEFRRLLEAARHRPS